MALPPASSWRPRRPGDLGPAQPRGELFGSPGPNVGYAYTLAERVKDRFRVGPNEHLDDAVAVVADDEYVVTEPIHRPARLLIPTERCAWSRQPFGESHKLVIANLPHVPLQPLASRYVH